MRKKIVFIRKGTMMPDTDTVQNDPIGPEEINVIALRGVPGTIVGRPGFLRTIEIKDLRVDRTYRRRMTPRSARAAHKIAMRFSWDEFSPLIVVRDGDLYQVVDGQFRAAAARTIGITELPCYVLGCDQEGAAASYAGINGTITAVTPQDIWFAEKIAKNADVLALDALLTSCGIRIVREREMGRVGDTRSVNELKRAYARFGPEVLEVILTAIVRTGDRGYGHLNGAVINGIGQSLIRKPAFILNPEQFYQTFDPVNLHELVAEARVERIRTGNHLQSIIAREVNILIRKADHAYGG
jgi:hypothetical protein